MKKTPATIAAMLFLATVALSQNNLFYADFMTKGLASYIGLDARIGYRF